jgi:hypothetical protein
MINAIAWQAGKDLGFDRPLTANELIARVLVGQYENLPKDHAEVAEAHKDHILAERRKARRNQQARLSRHARHEAYESAGMVKVRGNLGGAYYE